MTTPATDTAVTNVLSRASSETSPPAIQKPATIGQTPAGNTNGTHQSIVVPNTMPTPADGFLQLRVWSEMFEDAQRARIACTNRAERGGVDPTIYTDQLAALADAEHKIALAMRKSFRRVAPDLHAWMLDTPGVGEHLLARLLGCVGHPRHATPYHWEGEGSKRVLIADEPYERTVGQFWSYCGHGDPSRKKRKGMTAEEAFALGNPRAKMIVHLLAESCMKNVGSPATAISHSIRTPLDAADQVSQPMAGAIPSEFAAARTSDDEAREFTQPRSQPPRRRSPYRDTYDAARAQYVDRTHATECVRCGPSGKPALIDSPWSAAHQHAAALRLTGKEILRDLWIVAGRTPSQ